MHTQFVIVANRLPVRQVQRKSGTVWRPSPGGLVTALSPILREATGKWVGWSGSAGPAPAAFEHDGIRSVPVPLFETELDGFYEGFCNRTLWPLYHDVLRPPRFERSWWRQYRLVNRRFAEAAAEVADTSATVWVHDYHLQLVPGMLRALRPDLRIGFFLHIPFPPIELFAKLPWRTAILEGLLGADVVGFQTRQAAANFRALCRRFCGVRSYNRRLRFGDRDIIVAAFPISIDVEAFEKLAARPDIIRRGDELRHSVRDRRIVLGVDRLDYTKGIDIRLRAWGEMLSTRPAAVSDSVFLQIAVPSRERVPEYRQTRVRIEHTVGEVNGRFADIGNPVIHYMRRNYSRDELVALYSVADVMVVTPLRDGMNLVAKEYVASRRGGTGALVLSEFTGAATELSSALLVNPFDIDGLAHSMERALDMPVSEQRRRMRSMKRALGRNTVFDWARSFLATLDGSNDAP
jgi:trehalose 6-phosphate synthase